jgi:hypothetical protein
MSGNMTSIAKMIAKMITLKMIQKRNIKNVTKI